MKILAIDYGEKNIGLAFCDTLAGVPLKLPPLRSFSEEESLAKLSEIIEIREIGTIVFGLPLNFEFKETEQSEKTRCFAEKLTRQTGVETCFVNEALSSILASRLQESSKDVHSSSALLLLEDYLDHLDERGG